jgi:hypothetical protein
MSWLKKIKDRYTHRRTSRGDHDPWWVTLMLDVGRPLVAILILIMCAPGEHYLATEAGWSETLAWGMPGTLTAYAGIAAVVATKRPKGAPGRATAIAGAIVSIALAMAAQPIAHLYGKTGLNPQQIALTVAAGLIPAAVFGHLLHMGAAAPKPRPVIVGLDPSGDPQSDGVVAAPVESKGDVLDKLMAEAGQGIPVSEFLAAREQRPELSLSEYRAGQIIRTPQWLADNRAEADRTGLSVSEIMSAPDSPPDMATWTGQNVSEADSLGTAGQDTPDTQGQDSTRTDELSTAVVSELRPAPSNVRPIKKPTLSADVRTYLSKHPDANDEDLAAAMAVKWPTKPWDSVRKARDRYKESQENTGS